MTKMEKNQSSDTQIENSPSKEHIDAESLKKKNVGADLKDDDVEKNVTDKDVEKNGTHDTAKAVATDTDIDMKVKDKAETIDDVDKTVEKDEDEAKLLVKVRRQVEYYFGNYNLPRDKFLTEEVKKDNGWIALTTLLTFKRLVSLTKDQNKIMTALENSELIEVDKDGSKVRRSPKMPLPTCDNPREESIKRTVYLKGFPKDGSINLDTLFDFVDPYGPYETVIMRNYFDPNSKKRGFKGSILVVFETEKKAKEFMEIDDVKYKNTPLISKWYSDYQEAKDKEIKERRARKEAKKADQESLAVSDVSPFPTGVFLHLSNFPSNATREDIRETFKEHTDLVAFVEYSQGDPAGFVRLSEGNSNKVVLEKIGPIIKIKDAEVSVRIVEGDEEQEQMKKALLARAKRYTATKKRKFQGGRGSGPGKRRR